MSKANQFIREYNHNDSSTLCIVGMSIRSPELGDLSNLSEKFFSPLSKNQDALLDKYHTENLHSVLQELVNSAMLQAGIVSLGDRSEILLLSTISDHIVQNTKSILGSIAGSHKIRIIHSFPEAWLIAQNSFTNSTSDFVVILGISEQETNFAPFQEKNISGAAIIISPESFACQNNIKILAHLENLNLNKKPKDFYALSIALYELSDKIHTENINKQLNLLKSELNNELEGLNSELCHSLLIGKQKPVVSLSSVPTALQLNDSIISELVSIITATLAINLCYLPKADYLQIAKDSSSFFYRCNWSRPWIHPRAQELERSRPRQALVLSNQMEALLVSEYVSKNKDTNKDKQYSTNTNSSEDSSRIFTGKQSSEIFTFTEETIELLQNRLNSFLHYCNNQTELNFIELAYTLNCHINNNKKSTILPFALAIVANNLYDLKQKLLYILEHLATKPFESIPFEQIEQIEQTASSVQSELAKQIGIYYKYKQTFAKSKLAFVLPGLGASYPNMLIDLCYYFPEVRAVFDYVERLALKAGDAQLPSQNIFPLSSDSSQSFSQAKLATMDSAVVTLLLSEWAIFTLLSELGIEPDAFLGCSTGEFAALTMSKSIDIHASAETFYKLSTDLSRSISVEKISQLKSLIINTSIQELNILIQKSNSASIYLGADMSSKNVLVSGEKAAIEDLCQKLNKENIEYLALPIAIPYHTELVSGHLEENNPEILKLVIQEAQVESWSCSISNQYPTCPNEIRKITTELFTKPILFRSTIETMYNSGIETFIEVGPKGGLTPYINEILSNKPHLAFASNLQGRSGIDQLNHLLATLFINGITPNLTKLYKNRIQKLVKLPENNDQTIYQEKIYSDLHSTYEPDFSTSFTDRDGDEEAISLVSHYFETLTDLHKSIMQAQENVLSSYLSCTLTETEQSVNDFVSHLAFLSSASIIQHESFLSVDLFLSTSEHLFLLDHSIGDKVKNNHSVYLLPLMVALEIMAESASLLFPNYIITSIRDIRAYKRIRVEDVPYPIRVIVEKHDSNKVLTKIFFGGQTNNAGVQFSEETNLLASAFIYFAPNYLERDLIVALNKANNFQIKNVKKSQFSHRLYGQNSMFHGPRMQSVQSIDLVGDKSIIGKIISKEPQDWFKQKNNRQMLIDPLLLDNASQMVLYQMLEDKQPVTALLPFYINSIDFFAESSQHKNQILEVQSELSALNQRGTEANLNIFDQNNNLVLSINEINSRAIFLPKQWHNFVHDNEVYISTALNFNLDFPASVRHIQLNSVESKTLDDTVIDWFCDYILHPDEIIIWQKLYSHRKNALSKRHLEWLLGRIVAKESIKILVSKLHPEIIPRLAEISILPGEYGEPIISGDFLHSINCKIQLSISHNENQAVAIAQSNSFNYEAGIDITTIKYQDADFISNVFSPSEQNFLNSLDVKEKARCLSLLWTAKEATAKACPIPKLGLAGKPQEFLVDLAPETKITNSTGTLQVQRLLAQTNQLEKYKCKYFIDEDLNTIFTLVQDFKLENIS